MSCQESLQNSDGIVTQAQSWIKKIQILGDATEKRRASNDVHVKGTVSRLVLEDLRERAGV